MKENVCLASQIKGKKVDEKELNQVLKLLGLEQKKDSFANELSGGQQQRVAIGRAILAHTDIILADEPTGNLDGENAKNVMDILKALNIEGENNCIGYARFENRQLCRSNYSFRTRKDCMNIVKKYRSRNKKSYVLLFSILFLCTFLLTSLFVVKDSYDLYRINAAKSFYGDYDVKYTTFAYTQNKEYTDTYLDSLSHETPMPYAYKGTFDSLVSTTNFSVYPIRLIEGKYPKSNEVLIHKKYQNKYKVQDTIKLYSDQKSKEYTISGVYENLNNQLVNYSFYTATNSKKDAMYVYANLKDKSAIATLPVQDYELNSDMVVAKYHLNVEYENIFKFMILFMSVCCFLFVYSVLSVHLKKKKAFYDQLYILGMNKKKIRLYMVKEYTLLFALIECMGIGFTLLLWGLFLKWIQMNLPFSLHISKYHLCILLLILFVQYIFAFGLSLVRPKHYFFRKLNISNLSIVETMRNGNGLFIALIVAMSSMFICVSMQSLTSWIQTNQQEVQYEHDVSATFNIFDHTLIPEFIEESKEILKSYEHGFNYTIQCDANINNEQIETKVTDEYNDFVLSNSYEDNIRLHLYKQGGELIDVLDLSVEEHINSGDNKVLYIPESKVTEWLNTYPDTFITGDLWVNTKQSSLLKKKLDHIQLSRRDDFYVVDNKTDAKNLAEIMNMCQKIVQFYQFVLIITSIVIVYMQLYQHFYSHKNEYDLLHTIGMSYKKIRRMYIVKLLAFIIILDVIVLLIIRTIQMEVVGLYLIGSLILCTLFTELIFFRIYK